MWKTKKGLTKIIAQDRRPITIEKTSGRERMGELIENRSNDVPSKVNRDGRHNIIHSRFWFQYKGNLGSPSM